LYVISVRSGIAQLEPEIAMESVSVHRVERGNIPLLLALDGEIISLTPPQALVTVPAGSAPMPQLGQKASIQIKPPDVLTGGVVGLDRAGPSGVTKVRIELSRAFPPKAVVGTKLGTLIEVGELSNVVFFARPAAARANSKMLLFVIEPNGEFAKRTAVRFGRQSGPWIEILSGLSPGDRVIVTDTSTWTHERVRLK
jgi:HlyD family secretion protein